MKDPERYRIEQQVLGLCLEGRHMVPLDILRPGNFSDEFHRRVFTIMGEMALVEPIDMITVTRRYTLKHKDVKVFEIMELENVCERRCENSYSLLLLEIDIREKFTELLQAYEKDSVKENDFESAGIWKQCIDHLSNPGTDIFDGVSHIHGFLKSCKPDEVLEYEKMMQDIPKMVDRIKKQAQTSLLIENLKRNCPLQGNREKLFKITTDILLTLMISSEIHPDLANYLHHIQKDFL